MKRFIIFYSFFVVLMGGFIYALTLLEVTTTQTNLLYQQLTEGVKEGDIEPFLMMQSTYYDIVLEESLDNYDLYFVEVPIVESTSSWIQLGIFVVPKKQVLVASDINDLNDQTSMIAFYEGVIYNSLEDKALNDIAISYGVTEIGFYFYVLDIHTTTEVVLSLFDYEGISFYEGEIAIDMNHVNDLNHYLKGYSTEEIEELANITNVLQSTLIQRLTWYVAISIIVGSMVYFIKRRFQK
jgi:hypothetical protein